MDRKEIVKTLSETLGVTAKYLGAPSFSYEVKTEAETYTIDRYGGITNLQGRVVTIDEVLKGEHLEGKIEDTAIDNLDLEIPLGEHTGRTLMNILNMLYSKQQLIVKTFKLKEPFIEEAFIESMNLKKTETLEEFQEAITEVGAEGCKGITFNFEKGTFTFKLLSENLSHEKISAFIELASLINVNAQKLKHTSFKQAQEDNPKYAFRTWLIRLGGSLDKGRIMSMYNEDCICLSCKEKERKRSDYKKAVETDHEEIKKGNYNYKGIKGKTK